MPGIFLTTILGSAALMFLSTLIGRPVCGVLPASVRSVARYFLSTSLGLGILDVAASLMGRRFPLGSPTVVAVIAGALLICAWLFERNKKEALQHASLLAIFGLGCGAVTLCHLLLYGAFNSHNDAFTYLVQSDWLQTHAFKETISRNVVTPFTTQIAMYQQHGYRMGASYLLAFAQSAMRARWAYDAYPTVIIVAISSCSLALGFPLSRYFRSVSRTTRLILLILPTFSLSGLIVGASWGFLPQTVGLAFSTSFVFITGAAMRWVAKEQHSKLSLCLASVPCAVLFSALMYAYSEIVPFVSFAIIVCAIWKATKYRAWKRMLIFGIAFAVESTVLLNAEIMRAISAVRFQSSVVVGSPVNWSLLGFVAHAFSVHGGAWDGWTWASRENSGSPSFAIGLGVFVLVLLLAGSGMKAMLRETRSGALMPASVLILIAFTGVVYFRYFVPSPFMVGTGQSWSQFKLTDWIGPFLMIITLLGICRMRRRRHFNVLVRLAFGAGFIFTVLIAPSNLPGAFDSFINYYGSPRDLARVYLDLRETVIRVCKTGAPIYLDLDGPDYKARQMVLLYLPDREVKSDWTDDVYIAPFLPDSLIRKVPAAGDCLVQPKTKATLGTGGVVSGPFRVISGR